MPNLAVRYASACRVIPTRQIITYGRPSYLPISRVGITRQV